MKSSEVKGARNLTLEAVTRPGGGDGAYLTRQEQQAFLQASRLSNRHGLKLAACDSRLQLEAKTTEATTEQNVQISTLNGHGLREANSAVYISAWGQRSSKQAGLKAGGQSLRRQLWLNEFTEPEGSLS